MANWIHKENVEINGVFKKEGDCLNTYLLKLSIPQEDSIFNDEHEVYIMGSDFYKQLIELKEGKRDRCYFAYGMQNIDIYKVKENYAITHSPHEGLNIQLILKDGQFEELLKGTITSI